MITKRTFFINYRINQLWNDKQIDKRRFMKRLFSSSLRIFWKKKAKSNNAFDVKSMIMSTKLVETMKNANSARASILRSNAEHSMNTENVLTASINILREAFNATLKRKKSKNSTRYETTNHSCISNHRQKIKQRRRKIDFTSSWSRKYVRSLRFNKRWIFRHSKARSMISRWWVLIWTKTLTNFSFFFQFMINAIIRRNHQSNRRRVSTLDQRCSDEQLAKQYQRFNDFAL
jgi:hypothetical protein